MKTLFNENEYFNEDYYERGAETGKSLYSHYRWIPELTIPMCHHIARYMNLGDDDKVLEIESDFFKEFGMEMPKTMQDGGIIGLQVEMDLFLFIKTV